MKTKVAVFSNQSVMDKIKHFYGGDISKSFFDVMDQDSKHDQFSNDLKGFKSLLKFIKKDSLVVMEATGYYHYRLAQYLYEKGIAVSVVNPLSVKRFIQMKLSKIKTDKSDAKAICEYAQANEVPLYTARNAVQDIKKYYLYYRNSPFQPLYQLNLDRKYTCRIILNST